MAATQRAAEDERRAAAGARDRKDEARALDRILVRVSNWLGDALLARPLLHALRRAHPRAAIRAVAPAPLAALLASDPVVDRWESWPAAPEARRALVRGLRAFGPEAALLLPPSFSSAWFAWRSGAAIRVGFAHEGRSVLLTRSMRRMARGERHLSEEYLDLGRALGIEETAVPLLKPRADAVGAARAILDARGVRAERIAILGPGAAYGPAKRWGDARFAGLGAALARDGWSVLVCGAPAERETAEAVARGAGPGSCVLAGDTDLETQAALCALAGLAVCNDSGLAHLAAAVGAPTVAIFGSTSSAWTAPLGPRVRVLQRAPVCSPCFERTCRIGYRCMTAIGVDEALAACRTVAS